MSAKATTWAWTCEQATERRLLVLLAITDVCDDVGITWRGMDYLQEKTRIAKRSLQRCLNDLEEVGLILRLRRFRTDGTRTSNYIVVTMDLAGARAAFDGQVRDGRIARNPMDEPDGDASPSATVALGEAEVPSATAVALGDVDQVPPVTLTKCHSYGTTRAGPEPRRGSGPALETSEETAEREARTAAICDPLIQHVLSIDPEFNPDGGWAVDAQRLVNGDGHTVEAVVDLIAWATGDDFWATRVLSPGNLRRHWTSIVAARQRQQHAAQPSGKHKRQRRLAKLAAVAGSCAMTSGQPPAAAEAEWSTIAGQVRERLGDATYDIWLADAHPHLGEQQELLLAVPEPVLGWVRDRIAPAIDGAAGRHIEIVCCQEATP